MQPKQEYGTTVTTCGCFACIKSRGELNALGRANHMVVCGNCGNKRCPHAEDHRFKCTGSNESGQVGEVEMDTAAKQPVEQSTWREIGDLEGLGETEGVFVGGIINDQQYATWFSSKELRQAIERKALAKELTHWQPIAPVPRVKPMTEEEALKALLDPLGIIAKHEAYAGWLAHIEFIKKGGK